MTHDEKFDYQSDHNPEWAVQFARGQRGRPPIVDIVLRIECIWLVLRVERPHGISQLLLHCHCAGLEHVGIVRKIKDISLEKGFLIVLELIT